MRRGDAGRPRGGRPDPSARADPVRRGDGASRSTTRSTGSSRPAAGAGRRADFLTSPEVGPLFGAVIARALDAWWDELGRPDPFTVVEAAAGSGHARPGRCWRPAPECLGALTYVLVERSAALRARQRDQLPVGAAEPGLPALGRRGRRRSEHRGRARPPGRLAGRAAHASPSPAWCWPTSCSTTWSFRLLERGDRAAGRGAGRAHRRRPPAGRAHWSRPTTPMLAWPSGSPPTRPSARDSRSSGRPPTGWAGRSRLVERGRVVVLDYGDRHRRPRRPPPAEWLRTYRAHDRGGPPLDALGTQDITVRGRPRPARASSARPGVAPIAGRVPRAPTASTTWWPRAAASGSERAHLGDLEAIRARSRVGEAEALTDPAGLGAFHVLEWPFP